MDVLQFIIDFYIVPVLIWLSYLHLKQQDHATSIKVIESMAKQVKENHDREMRDINAMVNKVYAKLDKIEEFLRDSK